MSPFNKLALRPPLYLASLLQAAAFVRIPGGQSPERSRPGTSTGARPSTAPKDGKASGGAKQKDGAGKGGKGGKGGKAAAKAKTATPPPFPPPQNRTAGAHLSLKEEEQVCRRGCVDTQKKWLELLLSAMGAALHS